MSVVAPPGMRDAEVLRLQTLYELVATLSTASRLEDVYDAALTSLLRATSAERAAILLFDDDGVIRFKSAHGLSQEYQSAAAGHSPWRLGQRNVSPISVPDVQFDDSLAAFLPNLEREGIRALAFVPLADAQGVFGKLMLYYPEPHVFASDELEVSQAIAFHVAVAARKQHAEAARALAEQRMEAILDNSPTVTFIKDRDGRYLLVNRRFEELFHVSKPAVVGKTDYEIFPAEIAGKFAANDRAVLECGRSLAVEEHAPHDDGMHTYISVKSPLKAPDGTVTGVCGISTDITERNVLDVARRYLAAIIENTDDAIIGKDLNGVITSWNRGAERIFGYTPEEAIGQPVSMLAPPDRKDEMPAILAKIRAGGRVAQYETRRRTKDGRILDISLTVSPIRDSEGQIIGASKIARDISLRRSAEQERALLLAREKEARRTAELLHRVGTRISAELDPEKLLQEVTDVTTALVGAEFGSFFQHATGENAPSYMLHTLSGVPREAFSQFPVPRNTELFELTFRGEGVVRCGDVTGDPRYADTALYPAGQLPIRSYLAAPVTSRSGQVLGGLFFGHSLPGQFTEHHEALITGIAAQAAIALDNARLFEQAQRVQNELKASNEELRRANRDLEVFAYSASHDLQEPLRTIAISSELIERKWAPQLEGNDAVFLANIRSGARRMSTLIDDLLLYTRATRHEEGSLQKIDSSRVLASVLDGLRGRIDEAGGRVVAGDLPQVAIHESRLAQLFQNLIGNAIKYRGKETPIVHITAKEQDGWCIFSVSDNGIGIEPEFGEHIFGPFKRLHGRDDYPGNGIGLAICQRIVEQYGGRIWLAHSELGRGSTFQFTVRSNPKD